MPFIFIAMLVSANGFFGWTLLVLGTLAALSARNFAMGVNRYGDLDIDRKNPRTRNRPSVDGRISQNSIAVFIVLNAFIFIGVAYLINNLAFILSFPILGILASYTYFKRFSEIAHLILGISLGLAPIAGVVAVENYIPLWSLLLALGVMFWWLVLIYCTHFKILSLIEMRGYFQYPLFMEETQLFLLLKFFIL